MKNEKKKLTYYAQGLLSGVSLLITWLIIYFFHEHGPKQPVDFLFPDNYISNFGWSLLYAVFSASVVSSLLNGAILTFTSGSQKYKVVGLILLITGTIAALQAPSLITFKQTIEYFNLF